MLDLRLGGGRHLWPWVGSIALGCTPLSDFAVHQCEVHADCETLSGASSRCERSVCVEGCANNAHCDALDPRRPLCQLGGKCVALTSEREGCYLAAGYVASDMAARSVDDLVVIGAYAPTLRSSTWLSVQLAVDEINSRGGLPAGAQSRPLVVALCDPNAPLDETIEHLIHALQARAVLASMEDEVLLAALERPTVSDSALFLSPYGYDRESPPGPNPDRRSWYLGADAAGTVGLYAALTSKAVEALVALGNDADLLRVANLVSGSVADRHLASSVASAISIAGKGRFDLEREYRYLEFHADDPAVAQAVVDFAPDLILAFTSGPSRLSPYRPRAALIERLEALAGTGEWSPPLYILSARSAEEPILAQLARNSGTFRSRAAVISNERMLDPVAVAGLQARFQTAFTEAGTDAPLRAEHTVYDALYYLAYAAAAASEATAAEMAQGADAAVSTTEGLARITARGAEPLSTGPDDFARVVELLRAKVDFNLQGVTGEADFELPSRARTGAARVTCWGADGVVEDRAIEPGAGGSLELLDADCAEVFFGGPL